MRRRSGRGSTSSARRLGGTASSTYYVVEDDGRLVGVLPLRRLITYPVEKSLKEVMQTRVIALPQAATVLDACEFFVMHKFLAFPVVDEGRRVTGSLTSASSPRT